MEMDETLLERASNEYKRLYGGAGYYDLAAEIVDSYPVQGSIILLATWNTGRFRYLMSNNAKNLTDLIEAMEDCKFQFTQLKGQDFQSANFDEIKDILKDIYSRLSRVKGVEYTGASKVMHLLNPKLFLIWDTAMREEYDYDGHSAEDYFEYHKQVQKMVQNVKWDNKTKTLPKAIDEYHFITITEKRRIPPDR